MRHRRQRQAERLIKAMERGGDLSTCRSAPKYLKPAAGSKTDKNKEKSR
jgi:hypothetical protein